MCAGVLIATRCGPHEAMEYISFLLDLHRTGDDVWSVVIGNAVIGDIEGVQLDTIACSLNPFPTFKNPDKIDTVRFQGIHRVDAQCHILEYSLATVFLDDLAHNSTLIGCAKPSINLIIQHTRPCQS